MKRKGFTLIELLVVIANHPRFWRPFCSGLCQGPCAGAQTSCLANTRQLGTANHCTRRL